MNGTRIWRAIPAYENVSPSVLGYLHTAMGVYDQFNSDFSYYETFRRF